MKNVKEILQALLDGHRVTADFLFADGLWRELDSNGDVRDADGNKRALDIMNAEDWRIWQQPKKKVWVNIYQQAEKDGFVRGDFYGFIYPSRSAANRVAGPTRVACVEACVENGDA